MIIAETERILFRHFHAADLDEMAAIFANPEVMRFGPGPQSHEWTEKWIQGCLEDYYRKWGFGLWAVVYKPDNRVIGFCGLTLYEDIDGQKEIEVGYRLARACWGKGLATEAARATRDYAFNQLGLKRLISIIDPANTASTRVAEKINMRHEKEIVWKGRSVNIYVVHKLYDV